MEYIEIKTELYGNVGLVDSNGLFKSIVDVHTTMCIRSNYRM